MPAARTSSVGAIIGSILSSDSLVLVSLRQNVEYENLKRGEMKLMCFLRMKRKRGAYFAFLPRALRRIHLGGCQRQLECILQLDASCLLLVVWIAEHQDAFPRDPRSPAINLKPGGIAAYPVRVLEYIGVRSRPLC